MALFTYWLIIIAAVIACLTLGYVINRFALHRRIDATGATIHKQ